jgi:hypothetical protein
MDSTRRCSRRLAVALDEGLQALRRRYRSTRASRILMLRTPQQVARTIRFSVDNRAHHSLQSNDPIPSRLDSRWKGAVAQRYGTTGPYMRTISVSAMTPHPSRRAAPAPMPNGNTQKSCMESSAFWYVYANLHGTIVHHSTACGPASPDPVL